MKIILLQDISGVGRKYDVKNVADGYATNFLIPRKMAQMATERLTRQLADEKLKDEEEKKIQENLMDKNLESLANSKITIKTKANEKGHLFDSVYKPEIARALKEQLNMEIPEEYIELEEHIKSIGLHKVPVNFKGKKAEISVEVVAEL